MAAMIHAAARSPYVKDEAGTVRGAAYFQGANRGKTSVVVDIGKPERQRVLRAFTPQSGVVIENFRFGGLANASLKQVKPDIVYRSINGFGQSGPMPIAQAMTFCSRR